MNTSQHIPQTEMPPIFKLPFYTAVTMYELDLQTFSLLADMAKVDTYVVNAMFTNAPVHRSDAAKVLAAFSEYTRVVWTFDNMKVTLLPTFADICKSYRVDASQLSLYMTTVASNTVDMMLNDEPVARNGAIVALGALSLVTQKYFGLDNVDVALETQQTQP